MNLASAKLAVCCVAISLVCVRTNNVLAVTGTINGNANTDSANRPFFSTGGSAAGFSGSVASNTNTTSHVTGVGLMRAGTATLSDLSDGNHIPMGVTVVYGLTFDVTSMTAGLLFNGGAGGLSIASSSETTNPLRQQINIGEGLQFSNPQVTGVSVIDPLGLVQPGVVGSNPLFRAIRSPDHASGDSVTVSSDAPGTVDVKVFDGVTNFFGDDYDTGVFTPRPTVFANTTATNADAWRLKGIGYQLDVTFNPATSQPATRRTFHLADIPVAYDGTAQHTILDNDTSVTVAAVGEGALLDTNEVGVGINSATLDNAVNEGNQRKINGTLSTPESINISFDKKVSLESLTVGSLDLDGAETVVLSFVSGTNPFTGATGYSSEYTFGASSVKYKKTDPKGDAPYLITFGMGGQSAVVIEAGTVLSLTASPVTDNGILLDMITANLLAAPGVPGDYNNNGVVDAGDYVLWRKGGPLVNEIDTPNTVNEADYTEWRAHFGNFNPGSGVAAASIPEPSAVLLLSMAAFFCGKSRSRSMR
jgi:hypothetical protein